MTFTDAERAVTRNLDSFAAAYFRHWRALSDAMAAGRQPAEKRGRTPPSWQLDELSWTNPSEAWILILALVERAPSDEALSFVAAGPIVDLLLRQGADGANQIALEAKANSRFREALNHVWGWNAFADPVTAEVMPLLDPDVRAYWEARKAADTRGGAAFDAELGKRPDKVRWRPLVPPQGRKASRDICRR
jgi:hypothetical protein